MRGSRGEAKDAGYGFHLEIKNYKLPYDYWLHPWKSKKIPSQHLTLGDHQLASDTPFKCIHL